MDTAESTACCRFRRDGTPCTNLTVHTDGWCREPDCDGFKRQGIAGAPPPYEGPIGTKVHLPRTLGKVSDLEIDEIPHVRVTQRALESFRFHHGGSDDSAEAELRIMLEDFLLESYRSVSHDYVLLSRRGYTLVLAPDASAVTGYRTNHRERTWLQLKAGVRSRMKRRKKSRSVDPSVLAGINPGQEFDGTVVAVVLYGIFVDIGPCNGLVHSSQMMLEEGMVPSDVFSEGSEVRVAVETVDLELCRVRLQLAATVDATTETFDPYAATA